MKTITRFLLAFLLLLVAGTVSAQSLKVILEQDYSKIDSYPYYWMGDANNQPYFCGGTAQVEIVDGALRIYNSEVQANNWDLQPFILDWFNTTQGEDYVIRLWIKAEMDGSANLSIGTWGTSGNSTVEFTQSDDFQIYTVNHTAAVTSTGNDEHILFQMGSVVGTVYIQKVQILQMGEDKPALSEWGEWVPMINNSDMEGEDNSSFFAKIDRDGTSPVPNAIITEGVGVNDSRGIMVETTDLVEYAWDNQFWFRFNEPLEAGTKYRVSFDYRSDLEANVSTQAHAEPSDYIYYELFGTLSFTSDWNTYENEGTVTSQQSTADKKYQSVAFNLNEFADANNYYFDNIRFDVYQPRIDVQFSDAGIQILFPYYTNIVRLVMNGAKGKTRLLLPTDCFKVTVDGNEVPLWTVEADITGSLMIFFDEDWLDDNALDEDSKVVVSFINPEDETYRLLHIDTDDGEAVDNFVEDGRYNEYLDILPFTYGQPVLMASDPENGSFNLPNTISEFKLTFDKPILCDKIVVKLGNETLTANPATGAADVVTMNRTSTTPLADGEHTLAITKVYGEKNFGANDFASFEVTFSIGVKLSEELLAAIATAKQTRDENDQERYYGEALTALKDAIIKYEAGVASYTAPSIIDAAIIDLSNLVKAVNNHRTLVDTFDQNNADAQDLVLAYEETKYAGTAQFLQLKSVAEKYLGKELTDDEDLTVANTELKPIVDLCRELFLEGASNCGDAGIKVLVDRIIQGIETLYDLGVDETDPLIVAAQDAMTDDDAIVARMKGVIKTKLYEQMKNPENDLFPVIGEDDETYEPIYKRINMSVFIKNPNIYALQAHLGYSPENVPGWSVSNGTVELNTIWRHDLRQVEGLAEDIAFTKYHGEVRMEQTITDLPVGVYTVVLDAVDWDEGANDNGFVYAKTSDTPAIEEGEEEDPEFHFAGYAPIEFWGQYVGNHDNEIPEVVVTDGVLTLGVNFGPNAQWEFDRAKLFLTAPAIGFDYAAAYQEVITNVETAKTSKVRALQLYDLNGRRISTAKKGIVIMKKMMSDGTVKIEKSIR